MDIYFCDVCASRVTGADFKRGYGLRRGHVVVCGACVERGLGQELLTKARQSVAVGSGPLNGRRGQDDPVRDYFANVSPEDETDPVNQSLAASGASSESAALKSMASGMSALAHEDAAFGQATDDIADEEPAVLQARTQPAEDFVDRNAGQALFDHDDEDADLAFESEPAGGNEFEPEPDEQSAFADLEAPSRAPVTEEDLVVEAPDDDQIDGEDAPVGESVAMVDDAVAEIAVEEEYAPGPESQVETQEVEADQVPEGGQRSNRSSRQVPTTSARRRASSASTKKRSSSQSRKRSSSTRQTRATSSRSRKATQNPAVVYGVSAVTIGMLLIVVIALAMSGGDETTTEQPASTEERIYQVIDEVSEIRQQAVAARRSRDIGELKAARAAIGRMQGRAGEIEALLQSHGWTDDEIGNYFSRRLKWDEMQSHIRPINDLISQLEAQR